MANQTPSSTQAARRSAGFSLVEILLSLGIFAIGMTAIVSLFPAAAILQRETAQEVISGMAAESAAAIIDAQKLTYAPGSPGSGDLAGYYTAAGYNDTDAVPLYAINVNLLQTRYTRGDRSYPTGLLDTTAGTVNQSVADSDLFWIPFIQDLNGDQSGSQNWVVRLFIVEAATDVNYNGGLPFTPSAQANGGDGANIPRVVALNTPTVAGDTFTLSAANHGIEAGDIVMDSNGNSHVVVTIDGADVQVLNSIAQTPRTPDKLWFAPAFTGSSSPARRIVTVEVDVVTP